MKLHEATISQFFTQPHPFAQELVQAAEHIWTIPSALEGHFHYIASTNDSLRQISDCIWAEEGAVIEDGAQIEGCLILGRDSVVKKHTVIRGYNIIGRGCMIGNFVEIKNVLLYDHVQLPHLCYAGDSILGDSAHLGAGVKISNFKSWGDQINITFDDVKIATGLEKLGAIIGDHVEVGCNSVLYPATMIGHHSVVYPLCGVRGCLSSHSIMKADGTIQKRNK